MDDFLIQDNSFDQFSGIKVFSTLFLYFDIIQISSALFIGNASYDTPQLRFQSKRPANLMLMWDRKSLRVGSTCDLVLRIRPDRFISGLDVDSCRCTGMLARSEREGPILVLELLAGEFVEIH